MSRKVSSQSGHIKIYAFTCDSVSSVIYRVVQKIGTIILYALTLPNISLFSKLFHYQNQEKICNNTITKDSTTPQVCRYTTLWNVKCLKSNN